MPAQSCRATLPTFSAPRFLRYPLFKFAGVGTIATVVQLGLFAGLSLEMSSTWANVISWGISTLLANGAQRSLTFGVRDRDGITKDLTFSTVMSAIGLLISIVAINEFATHNTVLSLVVLIAVNCAIGLARFGALRWWFVARRA